MKKLFTLSALLVVILISLSIPSSAQHSKKLRGQPPKVISAADKTEIITIFRNLNPQVYYLGFNNGKESYGLASLLDQNQIDAIIMGKTFTESNNFIIGWYQPIWLLYAIGKTRTGIDLDTVLGKENATKLHAILTKYSGGSTN